LLGGQARPGQFYTFLRRAGEPIQFMNLDGPTVDIPDMALASQPRDHVIIQSGGKMWCGYEAFVDHIRALAPHLEGAHFFVGDEIEYIDEFRLCGGGLLYCRVHEGSWRPVDEFIWSLGLSSRAEPNAADPATGADRRSP
jgi:hypothetical protein